LTPKAKTLSYEEKLTALHRHAYQLGVAQSVDEITKCTLDAAEFALEFDWAEFCTVEENQLRLREIRGGKSALAVMPIEGPGIVTKAAKTKSTILVNDTLKDADYVDHAGYGWKGPPSTLSELAVPVLVDAEAVAVLNVESKQLNAFKVSDRDLLEILAFHVASAFKRLRHERKLVESERRLRLVTDNMLDMVVQTDAEGRFQYVSPSHERLMGIKVEDLVGTSIFERVHPEDQERALKTFIEGVQARVPRKADVRYKHGDGHYAWIESVGNPIFDEKDHLVGTIIASRDITERKRMEDEVRHYSQTLEELVSERTKKLTESEGRFRQMTDMLPESVFELDTAGRVIFLNQTGVKMLGYDDGDLEKGLNAFQVISPENHPALKANITRIMGGGPSPGYEYVVIRKDGTRFPAIAYASPITKEGKTAGLRGVLVDITERKKMEAALTKSQRLAAIGETAAMVGHDLRNPLQTTTTTLYLARRLLNSGKTEDRNEGLGLLEELDDQIYYMDKIVSDLQDYARPMGDQLVETNLPDLIKEAIANAKIPPSVDVSYTVQEGSSKATANPILLRRVLVNLMLNAVQAMPNGGKLTILANGTPDSAAITVQDNGRGIPAENLDRLFNPFFTTKAQGQGLGLAVCKRLVEAQGGEITVKSELGKGSTFTINLYANRAPGAS